jgi:hypothetical protein
MTIHLLQPLPAVQGTQCKYLQNEDMDRSRLFTVKPIASLVERSFTKGDPPQSSEVQLISKIFRIKMFE